MKYHVVEVGEDFELNVSIIEGKTRSWRARVFGLTMLLAAIGLFIFFVGAGLLDVLGGGFTRLSAVWDYGGPLAAYLIGQAREPRKAMDDYSS